MGKCLIIKGADFSANAVDNLNSRTDISSQLVLSANHRQYINYPAGGNNEQFMYVSNALNNNRIASLDVSGYRGRVIIAKIYGLSDRTDLAYACFASAVSVSLPWTGTSSVTSVVTAVEHITGKGTGQYGIYTLSVPQTANYLIFTDNTVNAAEVYLVNQ